MRIWIKAKRKDGKFNVRLSYDNGVVLNKIATAEKIAEWNSKPNNDAPLDLESYGIREDTNVST